MILLEAIDPIRRMVRIRTMDLPGFRNGHSPRAIRQFLGSISVREAQEGHFDSGVTGPLVSHECRVEADRPKYEAVFEHANTTAGMVVAYLDIVLSTYPEATQIPLKQLRLAAYELVQNVLEHGEPLHDQASLTLEVILEPRRVSVVLQDECKQFDPTAFPERTTQEQIEKTAHRGYGIMIARRLLKDLDHSYNNVGNRIAFTWRME